MRRSARRICPRYGPPNATLSPTLAFAPTDPVPNLARSDGEKRVRSRASSGILHPGHMRELLASGGRSSVKPNLQRPRVSLGL